MTSEASFWMVRLVVAVLGLGVGGWATWLLYTDPAGTRNWKVVPGIVGTALGLLAATRSFPYTSDLTIAGFPFPLAFFQREGTRWVDYISGLQSDIATSSAQGRCIGRPPKEHKAWHSRPRPSTGTSKA